jgi:hypothetical protein
VIRIASIFHDILLESSVYLVRTSETDKSIVASTDSTLVDCKRTCGIPSAVSREAEKVYTANSLGSSATVNKMHQANSIDLGCIKMNARVGYRSSTSMIPAITNIILSPGLQEPQGAI